jgi:alkylresorcinol/alkylpyrone synthase
VKRFIRAIYCPPIGHSLTNAALFSKVQARVEKLPGGRDEKESLLNFVRLQLLGNRSRYFQCHSFLDLNSFGDHAKAFEAAVDQSIRVLAAAIAENSDPPDFDAVVGVTSVGQLLPGIADRSRAALKSWVRPNTFLLDVGNGGCTASSRALQAAARLDAAIRNVLILVIEPASTLADAGTLDRSSWQGICTFGDGAAAIWISDEPGVGAVELCEVNSWHGKQLDLIRWAYGENYYRFGIPDLSRFESNVRAELFEALNQIGWKRNESAGWALHPAGMMLLLSVAKKLGIERSSLEPSIRHFRNFSNMSSASVFHILHEVMTGAKAGQEVRWLSMGAGFHVEYGTGIAL